MAQSAAERAIRTHKSVSLPPMNAYDVDWFILPFVVTMLSTRILRL